MNIISILGGIYMKKVRFLESKKLIAVIMSLSLLLCLYRWLQLFY